MIEDLTLTDSDFIPDEYGEVKDHILGTSTKYYNLNVTEEQKENILESIEITKRVKKYFDSISEESLKSSHLWHPEFNNAQMHSIISGLQILFARMLIVKADIESITSNK